MKNQPYKRRFVEDDLLATTGTIRFSKSDFLKLIGTPAGKTQIKNIQEKKAIAICDIICNLFDRIDEIEKIIQELYEK